MCTSTAESRDAMARRSAQETVFGQAHSSILLMVSITSNPLAEFLLPPMFFSVVMPGASSNRRDPSHPYKLNSRHINSSPCQTEHVVIYAGNSESGHEIISDGDMYIGF